VLEQSAILNKTGGNQCSEKLIKKLEAVK